MKAITIILIVVLTTACNGTKGASKNSSDLGSELNGSYTLVSMNGEDMTGNSMELSFNAAEKSVSGSSACNKLFGSFSLDGEQLSISGVGATKMYCDGKMDLEKEFLQGLQVANAIEFQGDQIMLKNNEAVLMTFKQQQ